MKCVIQDHKLLFVKKRLKEKLNLEVLVLKKCPTASILMSTYNGSIYLEKQLESIKNQKFPVTQVSIIDDHSTDDTVDKIRGFIQKNDLINWHLQVNSRNMGWRHNFFELLYSVKTDYVFFADQDDIWNKNKISKMVHIAESETVINVLVSDYNLFGGSGSANKMSNILENKVGKDVYQVSQQIRNLQIRRDGCSFMIRREFIPKIRDLIKYVPVDIFGLSQSHDLASWLAAVLDHSLYHVRDNLIDHRIHADSAWSKESVNIDNSLYSIDKKMLSYYISISNYLKKQVGNEALKKEVARKIKDVYTELALIESKSKTRALYSFFRFSSLTRYLGSMKRIFNVK